MDDPVFSVWSGDPQPDVPQPFAPCRDDDYVAFASNLKRNPEFGRHLGSFQLWLPTLDLHLAVAWVRDQRGREFVGMPRIRVEAPDGKIHFKRLARWGSARAEDRFQRAALAALHTLIARTESRR